MNFTIVGYHGTDEESAQSILADGFNCESGGDHWFGPGAYFWENDSFSAWWWVCRNRSTKKEKPAIIMALVDFLPSDVDLSTAQGRASYRFFIKAILASPQERQKWLDARKRKGHNDDAYFLSLWEKATSRFSVRAYIIHGERGYNRTVERITQVDVDSKRFQIKSRVVSNGTMVVRVHSDERINQKQPVSVDDMAELISNVGWNRG